VTGNSLQAVVYRGGTDLWVGGRGGAILKRSETFSTIKTTGAKLPPLLRSGRSGPTLKKRIPLITVTDDGDIPPAGAPPKKEN
jgi:hypothetical protein